MQKQQVEQNIAGKEIVKKKANRPKNETNKTKQTIKSKTLYWLTVKPSSQNSF